MKKAIIYFLGLFILFNSNRLPAQRHKVTLLLDTGKVSKAKVSPLIFGRFFELNGRDAYPGFVSQHLANGSFEHWNERNNDHIRDELLFRDIPIQHNVAYPWQVSAEGKSRPAIITNGKHGHDFQRLINLTAGNQVTLSQRTATPDQRTLSYDIRFWARSNRTANLKVSLQSADSLVVAAEQVKLSADWQSYALRLTLPQASNNRYRESPFGIFDLQLSFSEQAIVDIDHVQLVSSDAVTGIFNPTTIQNMKEYRVKTIRWPGGNYASRYRWTDGIGNWEQRPVSINDEWGGLEPNYFGTNEFLAFCRLSGVEPYINVPFNPEIATPEYIAQWVEYVNGDTTTAMGKLRKQHGYPEPWKVKYWQVGNEHYGPYQAGYVFAPEYAEGVRNYILAMKNVDPEIKVLAAGADPMYTDHDAEIWNRILLEKAGDIMDGIDIHRYANRVTVNRKELKQHTKEELLLTYMGYPSQYDSVLSMLTEEIQRQAHPMMVNVGEWNMGGFRIGEGYQVEMENMWHAVFVAGMYNAFLRKSEFVKFSHQTDNTLWFRPYLKDFRPINPGAYVLRMFAEIFDDGKDFYLVPCRMEGETFNLAALGQRIMTKVDVPLADVAALQNDKTLVLFLTNRDPEHAKQVLLPQYKNQKVTITSLTAPTPFAEEKNWNETILSISRQETLLGKSVIEMPPASVFRLEIDIAEKKNQ
ncbi:hypothetical protein V6R21_01900 [Limibacter armeniacum]|uniref:hypothetical protein n=1 Tax=Limibacter armeniacum TaxID=466084 RepID=UPI002FE584CF